MRTIVFGTKNLAKIAQIQGALRDVNIEVVGLPEDLEIPEENGETAQENAREKATTYATVLGKPVLSMDNALFIEGLSPEKQPGIHVRRIGGTSDRPTDKELLDYYSALVGRFGNRVNGRWEFALCYARPDGTLEEGKIVSPRIFVSTPSSKMVPGYPLESIQVNPMSGKYISEMEQDEQDAFWQRAIGQELLSFVLRTEA